LLDFVVGVESQFYPQIGKLYERRIEAWGPRGANSLR
jgi:hypothetical protein